MKSYKRIISAFFAFAILICIASPARADYQSSSNIWQWIAENTGSIPQHILGNITTLSVCPESSDAKHHAASCVWDGVAGHYVCTCDVCGQTFIATYSDVANAYDNYVNDLPSKSINSDGKLIWTPRISDVNLINPYIFEVNLSSQIYSKEINSDGSLFISASLKYESAKIPQYGWSGAITFSAPIDGYYYLVQPMEVIDGSDSSFRFFDEADIEDGLISANQVISFNSIRRVGSLAVSSYSYIITMPVFQIAPSSSAYSDYLSIDYRPTSITGDYSVVGDNNEVTVFDETIFNEDNSTFFNPVTGDTHNVESWSYDYSTRTYTMTDENDNSSTLTYGDDNIIINDGGNTFTIYYGDVRGSFGGGSSSDPTDTGIFGAIGNLLGTLVNGLLGGIAAFLTKILDGLTSLATVIGEKLLLLEETILGWFDTIPAIFSGFLAFLTAAFPFIPADIMLLLTFGLAAVVFIGIIKAIRR